MAKITPLCVDLDGTLVKSDTLHEALRRMLLQRPWLLLSALKWLTRGKAYFKRQVAERIRLDPARLPYNEALLDFLRQEHARGRKLILASASDILQVQSIADHLGCFAEVYGSDGAVNLSGLKKLSKLRQKFGSRGFDYAGNSRLDLAIWAHAREAIVISDSRCFIEKVKRSAGVSRVFGVMARNRLYLWLSALRVHQWVKNLLIFLPLIMAHRALELELIGRTLLAFAAFSLCASSVYLTNDLIDLEADRQHHLKKKRALASGEVSQLKALVLIPLLFLLSLELAWYLPHGFFLVLVLYFVGTLSYSLYFKKHIVADIVLLALLYTLRILAGGHAAEVNVSQWLLAFSMFFFLSLACLKRFSELRTVRLNNRSATSGRGYLASDLESISQFGTASGYLSVLVLALYVSSHEVSALYAHPQVIWLVCPLILYWISRIWLLGSRGLVQEDPILFAIGDKVSYLVGLISVLILFAAL